MGSRNSKLNPEGEAVPAKLRPLVRRWFDEIRRRKSPNISKKELLINDGVEEDGSNSQPLSVQDNERKSSTSSSDESVASSSKVEDEKSNVQVPVPAEDPEKTSKEAKENKDVKKCEKQDEKDGTGQKEEKEVKVVEKAVVVEEVFVLARETVEDDEEDEEEGNEDEKVTFGSPSFRVYCIPSTDNNNEESKDESTHRNSGSGESVESNSDEGQEKKTKKKGNRGRRLKRAIKSGPVAVKNLLNVTSCYHPGCSGNDRARLLAEKAEG